MKSNIFKTVVLGAVLMQLALPASAFAEERRGAIDGRPKQENFCARIAAFKSQSDEELYSREVKLKASRNERAARSESKRKERDEKLSMKRDSRQENINEHFKKIESRNLTDEQKAALETFKSAHASALAARKAAVDSAIATYRNGVKNAIDAHETSIDSLLATFRSAVKAAHDKAIADCQAGVDQVAVKEAFIASIKAAKDAFAVGRADLDNRGDIIKPLIEARNAAFKKAAEDFRTAMEKARADLKAVFPEKDR